jgi:hypothetical protein
MTNTAPAIMDQDPPNCESPRSRSIRMNVKQFCDMFVSGAEPLNILQTCFVSDNPCITEHGPSWANEHLPYLGRTFHGRRSQGEPTMVATADECARNNEGTCDDYFDALGKILTFHAESLPHPAEFIVDASNERGGRGGSAVVKVSCELRKLGSRQGWTEQFIFMFRDFTREGKIGHLEIWADSLSAWNAVIGPTPGN